MGCLLSSCLLSALFRQDSVPVLPQNVLKEPAGCALIPDATRRVVLVTRPEPGLSATMKEMASRGWFPLAAPMLEITPNMPAPFIPGTALAITSAQALPFLQNQPRERLLLTVGKKTARKAREAGFVHVLPAEGNARALRALCLRHGISGEKLVLATGRGWNGQVYGEALVEALGAQRVEAYQVSRHNGFGRVVRSALLVGLVDSIVFYSIETVAAFMHFCPKECRPYLQNCRVFCLSDAIAHYAASQAKWRHVSLLSDLESYQSSAVLPVKIIEGGEGNIISCPLRACPNFAA